MRFPRILASLVVFAPPAFAADPAFSTFVETVAADWMRTDPEAATTQQFFTGAEQDALDRRLTPVTAAYRAERVALARRSLQQLAKFDRLHLDESERISAAMLERQLRDRIEADAFEPTRFVFQQFSGIQVQLVNFLTQTHPIRNRRDVENYLARLQLVAATIADGIVDAKDRAGRGFLPPRFILQSTVEQFERFLAPPVHDNVLVTSLRDRMAKVRELTETDRAGFVDAAEKLVGAEVVPAFRAAEELLRAQLPHCTDDAGLWRFPNGPAAYAQALHQLTTTDYSAAEIHALGLKEVARIEAEMNQLLQQLGYETGTIKARMEQLERDSQPASNPDPRPMLLARYEAILQDAQQRAAQVFDLQPRAPVIVQREPVFTEKNAAAHYTAPARDGSRPGIFWAPLPGPTFEMAGMRTLVYHEAVPGHHFQIALQQENPSLPRFRRDYVFGFISACGEGWALYAEQLAAELGWYADDPKGHLGQLNDELFRARRLVVDTGLHAMHWTRQQAIDYGIPAAEVERYVVWPGQACSYKIGQLKILALRARTNAALGDRFSLKAFHNVVLRTGGVPLDVLELAIDDFIAANRR